MDPERTAAQERVRLGRFLSHLVARDPSVVDKLLTDEEGQHVAVPVLGDDRLVDVSEVVATRGGRATLVALSRDVPTGPTLRFLTFERRVQTGDPAEASTVPFGPESTVGDLMGLFSSGASVTIHFDDLLEARFDRETPLSPAEVRELAEA